MDEESYMWLLEKVTPLIVKEDTIMRPAVSPHERLSATLRFIISGSSYQCLRFQTAISQPLLSSIIPETCSAIITALKDYMQLPRNQTEWLNVSKDFNNKWQFPNCLGAADGKHVRIIPPSGSGSQYFNYKKYHSVVLLAVADANYSFIMCDVGASGSNSDGGCIQNTKFYQRLLTQQLNLPQPTNPPNSELILPYTFIGDEAFSLRVNFLKPFNRRHLNYERRVFNYRLSRARRVVENAFGIMASRFQLFHTPIQLKKIENTNKIILTYCYLHNFLRIRCVSYIGTADSDITYENHFSNLQVQGITNQHSEAKAVREKFVQYLNNEGRVEWQDDAVQSAFYG
ncbi:uncharacterized protein LOC118515144 [Anopheles stephensi]|uniref:uncharacterized protein LOC118515144 n=1 Tax=Anopheles stephensi TaxID=30069 RepID=UPI0016587CA8|nr:uncharacterized protein LOC118515144 [Anopheles stephensi]